MKYILTLLLLVASLVSHAQVTHDFRNTPLHLIISFSGICFIFVQTPENQGVLLDTVRS